MTTLNELNEKRAGLQKELRDLNDKIEKITDLPMDWGMDSDHGHMAGGVTLYGRSWYEHREKYVDVSICAYSGGLFIVDEDGNRSPTVDIAAVKAAIKALEIKEEEQKKASEERREARRKERAEKNRL